MKQNITWQGKPTIRQMRGHFNPTSIPQRLKEINRWCYWYPEQKSEEGRFKKIPRNPTEHSRHSWTDPNFGIPFSDANEIFMKYKDIPGLGLVLRPEDRILVLDFDNCIVNGKISPEVMKWVEEFGSYTEISISKTGIHIFIEADRTFSMTKMDLQGQTVEIYPSPNKPHFIAVTGSILQ
jgi:primase-polymerase (primpol)-like protein